MDAEPNPFRKGSFNRKISEPARHLNVAARKDFVEGGPRVEAGLHSSPEVSCCHRQVVAIQACAPTSEMQYLAKELPNRRLLGDF